MKFPVTKSVTRTFFALVLAGTAGWIIGAESTEKKDSSPQDERSDRKKLAGLWQVDGVKGRPLIIPIGDLRFGTKLIYTLRPDKKPKEIDLLHGGANDHPRVTANGIYSLKKDKLKVCWVFKGARPTEFKSDPKQGQHMLTMTRIKRATAE